MDDKNYDNTSYINKLNSSIDIEKFQSKNVLKT